MKLLLLLCALVAAGCRDMGAEPPADPLRGWRRVQHFQYVKSNWLDMISVRAWVEVKPDSMMIEVGADGGSRFTSGSILGGGGEILCRFFFNDGYVDRLPADLRLGVFIK